MRPSGRAKPRGVARFISIKESGHCFYFEINPTGALAAPPDLSDGSVIPAAAPAGLSACLPPPNPKARPGYHFLGFFDSNKIKTPTLPPMRLPVPGYSIQDILAGPTLR
jgi:hypothetical protein